METTTMVLLAIGLVVLIAGAYFYYYMKDKKEQPGIKLNPEPDAVNAKQLKLQAYERLVILAERIALPNVISRNNESGLDKRDMQQLLTQAIRHEFDYNLSQQIYVSNEAWEAIRNLKEQNVHIINQIASFAVSSFCNCCMLLLL